MNASKVFTHIFELMRYSTNDSNYYTGDGKGGLNRNYKIKAGSIPEGHPGQCIARFIEYENHRKSTDHWAPPQDDWIQ